MSLQPYQFDTSKNALIQQADGQFIAEFSISTYEDQSLRYEVLGLNAENLREILVVIEGNETEPVTYQDGQTTPFTRLPNEIGVELVAEKDKKREGSTIIYHL